MNVFARALLVRLLKKKNNEAEPLGMYAWGLLLVAASRGSALLHATKPCHVRKHEQGLYLSYIAVSLKLLGPSRKPSVFDRKTKKLHNFLRFEQVLRFSFMLYD